MSNPASDGMPGPDARSSIEFALLVLALLLAITLYWSSFAREPLAIDEHVSFWIADRSSPATLLTRSFQYSATPPLSFALQRLSVSLLGVSEWAFRLPAAASFLTALAALWWVARQWLSPPCSGIAAMLLALHPGVASIAVAGRPYSLGLLLSTLSLHATARLCAAPNQLRWVGLVAINLALIHTHYLFAALWVAEFVWLAHAARTGRLGTRQILVWIASLFVCALTVMPGIWRVWNDRLYLNWTTQQTSLRDLLMVAVPVHLSWLREGWAFVIIPFAWQVAARRYRPVDWFDRERWQASHRFIGLCLIWLAVPATALWLIGRFWLASLAADRYLIIFAPVTAVIWAGLFGLLRGTVAPILTLCAAVLWTGCADRLYTLRPADWRPSPSNSVSDRWKEAAETINIRSTPGDLVLVGSGLAEMSLVPVLRDDPVFHDYVSCRLGRMYLHAPVRRLSLPMFWPRDRIGQDLDKYYRAELARVCAAIGRPYANETNRRAEPHIWLVAATDTDLLFASAQGARAVLQSAGAIEIWSRSYGGLDVVQYECPH